MIVVIWFGIIAVILLFGLLMLAVVEAFTKEPEPVKPASIPTSPSTSTHPVPPPVVKLEECKPEVTDLYAWKLFTIVGSNRGIDVYPLVQHGFGAYKVIEANWYLDRQIEFSVDKFIYQESLKTGQKPTEKQIDKFAEAERKRLKSRTPIIPRDLLRSCCTHDGFFCFNAVNPCLAEIRCSQSSKKITGSLIAKIRIWGDIVEADWGYRAEYFELVDLWTTGEKVLINNKEFNTTDEVSIDQVANLLQWPFGIKCISEYKGTDIEPPVPMPGVDNWMNQSLTAGQNIQVAATTQTFIKKQQQPIAGVCVKSGAWMKEFPAGLTVAEYRKLMSSVSGMSSSTIAFDGGGSKQLAENDIVMAGSAIEFVRG